jgi:hypothetical protein
MVRTNVLDGRRTAADDLARVRRRYKKTIILLRKANSRGNVLG